MATKKNASGAVPRDVRQYCRTAFAESVPYLAEIAKGGEKVTSSERIKALEMLSKFGNFDVDTVLLQDGDVAQAAIRAAHALYGPDRLEEFADRLEIELVKARDDD